MTKSIDLVPTWFWPEGVPRHMSPPRATAYTNTVERWARRRPEAVAIEGARPVTYAQLDEHARVASANLTRRIGGATNPRLALVAGTDYESAAFLLAAMHSGSDTLLIDEATPWQRRVELVEAFRARLLVASDPSGDPGLEMVTFDECLDPVEVDPEVPQGGEGRVAFEWDASFALHPTATLLGWALAFRAFVTIHPSQIFLTMHRLASWDGVTSLLASLCVGSTHLLPFDLRHSTPPRDEFRASGAWIIGEDADALADHPQASRWLDGLEWIYLSVDAPLPARSRRRIARQLRTPVLTILGTPATGPVAASPREWFIDEAVGIPFTGVDLIPLDDRRRPALPPWHLITAARVGVQSSLLTEGFDVEGPRQGSILPNGVVDIEVYGRMDANGFLYLI